MGYFRELPNILYQSPLLDKNSSRDYIVIKNIFIQFELNYSVSSIFISLQIFWGFLFWITNLYSGDAQTSRFVETENLIKLTFFIMATAVFLIGIDVNLGPIRSQYIIRYWIFFTSSVILIRWIVRTIQKFLLKKGFGRHSVIIVGTEESSKYVTEKLLNHGQKLYNVIGTIYKILRKLIFSESSTAALICLFPSK